MLRRWIQLGERCRMQKVSTIIGSEIGRTDYNNVSSDSASDGRRSRRRRPRVFPRPRQHREDLSEDVFVVGRRPGQYRHGRLCPLHRRRRGAALLRLRGGRSRGCGPCK